MKHESQFLDALKHTRIIKPPKHAIATFGTTTLRYVLLSAVTDEPDYCRLREGEVTAQRPKILTPEFWQDRFHGFGEESETFHREIEKAYGEDFKGLEYSFRNELKTTSLEHATLSEVADRARQRMDEQDALRTALIEGPDRQWSLSVMKFIVDMSLRSFPANVRELDERGMFNPEKHRIEKLFQQAQHDRNLIPQLANTLKQAGLFADYEDRFFSLVGR